MQLELKRIQHDVGITFVHVTHDQEEAMTMADSIAVMNHGRIEQVGPRSRSPTAAHGYVAGFLGSLELAARDRLGRADGVRLDRADGGGGVDGEAAVDRDTSVAIGIRPEKIRVGAPRTEKQRPARNRLRAGIHRRLDPVDRRHSGRVKIPTVYLQNTEPGAVAGGRAPART